MNKLKDSIGSATEHAVICFVVCFNACFAKCFFLEACQICADYSLELLPTLLENFLKKLNILEQAVVIQVQNFLKVEKYLLTCCVRIANGWC